MFERIAASFALAQSSWRVLRRDKQLVVFPALSGLACVLVLAGFALPLTAFGAWGRLFDGQGNVQTPAWVYAVAFAYYACNYFVIIFCNAALVSCALLRFSGHRPTVAAGFRAAWARLPQILGWTLVSATVGLGLKVLENASDKIGGLVSRLLGTAWTVVTYFVVPVLVVERVGPLTAVRRSAQILRKTWGEALVGKLGLGLYVFLLSLPGMALLVGGVYLMAFGNHLLLGGSAAAAGAVYLVIGSAVGSALNGIFLSALYQYAEVGEVPRGFDRDVLERAFGPR
jgi:hypothetical protein